MERNNQGLTATYNRFHDPEERDQEIEKLRELHELMDRAVLDSYGWADIETRCDYLLDYEDAQNQEDIPHEKKRPWRYRWVDVIRDEVLARLLELNRQRAVEEAVTEGGSGSRSAAPSNGKARKRKASGPLERVPDLLIQENQ